MAGLAIGLVNTTVALFPNEGVIVGSMVLAAVAILETIGPPIAARALRWSGDQLDEPSGTESPRAPPAHAAPSPVEEPGAQASSGGPTAVVTPAPEQSV
ncbi:hypothetical protein D3C71_1857650 [compost metagenome]